MEKYWSDFTSFLRSKETMIILFVLFYLSGFSFYYFFSSDQLLLYGDSLSRMNISRKIVDNLTPGFAQLGNVWLPLPQLLMLPFTSNDYLWHSGIAGSIVSMTSYILGGLFLFKSAKIITKSFLASFLSLSIYALNTNILYLQVTAMSESIFLCSVSATIYFLLMWIKSKRKMSYLILSAISIGCATLIRYEALALLFTSILSIFLYSYLKEKSYKKSEGSTLLFATLACLGFALWTFYLTTIFGDPLYWKNYYAAAQINKDTQVVAFTQHLSLIQSFMKYMTAVVWMNGLIPVIFAIIALPLLAYSSYKEKSYYFLPVLLSFAMFAFMILTLQRNTPIDQPALTIANILNPQTFKFPEFNMRYGLLMLPMLTLLSAYLFRVRYPIVKIILVLILSIQFYSYANPAYAVIFQLPINVSGNITQGTQKEKNMTAWLKQNYKNEGPIMISALKHDPQMLQLGLNYKTYIHEGTDRYWKESQKYPQRYAAWIVLDSYNENDQVTKYLKNSQALNLYYNRVYDNDGMWIYKIKTRPDIIL